jgi:hypothetical protein
MDLVWSPPVPVSIADLHTIVKHVVSRLQSVSSSSSDTCCRKARVCAGLATWQIAWLVIKVAVLRRMMKMTDDFIPAWLN